MLCVSTTPGTRRAAAATRSLGASAPALGSTCTVTWAGPISEPHRVLDPVHGLVAALQPLQPGDADHHVGEALAARLAHAHRAHLGNSRHLSQRLLDLAGRGRWARDPSAHPRCAPPTAPPPPAPAQPPPAPRPRRPRGIRRRPAPGRSITAVVPAKSDAKCHALARSAAFRSRRPVRSETVARPASTTSTPTSSTKAYQCASTSPPPERSRITASKPIQQATAARSTDSDSAARCWALP